jgi:nanoRNase/pAp phosphatase (c-di-AMP/oligoRNAs hydrolase)
VRSDRRRLVAAATGWRRNGIKIRRFSDDLGGGGHRGRMA